MKRNLDPLKDSLYRTVNGIEQKSCPCCSRSAGRAVFYPLESFGERNMGDGETKPQAWCNGCRGAKKAS